MFEKSMQIIEKINREAEHRSPSTKEKIELANRCLNKVKTPEEYDEIEAIVKQLEADLKRERHGFFRYPYSREEEDKIVKTINAENKAAEKRYLELIRQADKLLKEYLEASTPVLQELREITAQRRLIGDTIGWRSWGLFPEKFNMDNSKINTDPRLGFNHVYRLIRANQQLKQEAR